MARPGSLRNLCFALALTAVIAPTAWVSRVAGAPRSSCWREADRLGRLVATEHGPRIRRFDDFSTHPTLYMHVQRGNTVTIRGKTFFSSGMHTWEGLNRFLNTRSDVARQRIPVEDIGRGVQIAKLPADLIAPKTLESRRRYVLRHNLPDSPNEYHLILFPRDWDELTLLKAMNHAIEHGLEEVIASGTGQTVRRYDAIFRGVPLRVVTTDSGVIETLFPNEQALRALSSGR